MKKFRFFPMLLSIALVMGFAITGTVFAANADSSGASTGETTPPEAEKTLVSNGDGTYRMSLSVTGTAETTTQSGKADVIVVLDRSGSMSKSVEGYLENAKGRYGLDYYNYVRLYYKSGGTYRRLDNDTYEGPVYTRSWGGFPSGYTYTEYTGTRYAYMNTDRISVAKSAVNSLADQLQSYNENNPDAVRFSLVTFADDARTETFGGGSTWTTDAAAFKNKVNSRSIYANGGTNWEDALQHANGLSARDDAKVYVIFVSDGNPTFYVGGGTGYETSGNVSRCYDRAKDDAKAIVDAGKNFYGIGVFGDIDRMQSLVSYSGAPSENYYDATDSASLQAAFSNIVSQITNAFGYKNVKVKDGLTSITSALVETDPDSFTYKKSGGSYGSGTAWTPDDAQKAVYENGKVTWDLGDMQLENGVTYTVSFKVWPSQEAYDLAADLNNGTKSYDDLSDAVKKQIIQKDGGYALVTNTEADLDYTQIATRTTTSKPEGYEEGKPAADGYTYTYDSNTGIYTGTKETKGTSVINSHPSIPLTNSQITVEKKWNDATLGSDVRPTGTITLNLMKDGKAYKTLELSSANDWKTTVYTAPGLIADGKTLEAGHTYSIEEPSVDVHYEFLAEDFQPMLVNNKLVADYKNGKTEPNAVIKVTNTRKGALEISKKVKTYDGGTVDENQQFEMKVTFQKDDKEWTPSASDQVTYRIGNGQEESFPSDGVIQLKNGETAVISNLPAGVKYKVTEQNIPAGYKQTSPDGSAEGTISDDSTKTAAFTNTYSVKSVTASIPVTKKLSIPDGLAGPKSIKGAYTFTLKAVTKNAPMPKDGGETVKNPDSDGGTASFGAITFDTPGTYKYKITETGSVSGVINDSDAASGKEVTVTVEDQGDGTLTAKVAGATPEQNDPAATAFTNTYRTSVMAEITLSAGKKLSVKDPADNPPDITEKYDLTLTSVNNSPMPEGASNGSITVKNPDGKGTAASFGTIKYTQPGVYQYTVSESGNVPGVTNGQTSYSVSVKVTDNQDGTLTASVSKGEKKTVFTNTYAVSPVTLAAGKISVSKNLTGTNLAAGAFNFKIQASDKTPNAPLPASVTVTNDAKGTASFGAISYTKPGRYVYDISEIDGGLSGYTYDKKVVHAVVTVKDSGNGTLTASVEYQNEPSFSNTYKADGSVQITAQKLLTGRTLKDGQFSFTLTPGEGAPGKVQTKTNNASGQVVFDAIDFSNADLTTAKQVKKTYKLRYVNAADANDVLDAIPGSAEKTEDGGFTIGSGDSQKTYNKQYVNTDDKTDVLNELPKGAAENGDGTYTVTETTKSGYGEKTFTYTIKENASQASGYTNDTHTETVNVTVKDNGDGTLSVKAVYDPDGAVFRNTYSAKGTVVLKGTKSVKGKGLKADQFQFSLMDKDNNVLSTAKNDADGSFTFDALNYTEADAGKTFTYYVSEVNDGQGGYTYDSKVYKVTVKVTDPGNGALETEFSTDGDITFVNTYAASPTGIQLNAQKTLTGKKLTDGEFSFIATLDGKTVATGKNDADGNITFSRIPITKAGIYKYTISEVNDGAEGITYDKTTYTYVVTAEDLNGEIIVTDISLEGGKEAVFKNTYTASEPKNPDTPKTPDKPKTPSNPNTSDSADFGLWISLMGLGAAGLAGSRFFKRRKQQH
ncbi:MAG: FctA domain-containing protein [Eubacteriales bacterium]|nr:FctA domain-containing protein [Eubacteriales bacterium]